MENKGESGHFLNILENLEILEIPPVPEQITVKYGKFTGSPGRANVNSQKQQTCPELQDSLGF